MSEETYRIAEWLARAADDPEQARGQWTTQGVALLRCGRRFDAVRIPADLVHAALGTDEAPIIAAALPFDLGGPVILDRSHYYALIFGHSGMVWDEGDDTPRLGPDTYLGVPRLDRMTPPGAHWVVPPQFDGDVCRPNTVRLFIARARTKLASAAVEA